MTSTSELLAFALELVDLADGITMRHYRGGGDVRRKADGTLVTLADTSAESAIRTRILERFPTHVVEGEEEGLSLPPMPMDEAGVATERVKWIVDPIDGTHNFARGAPVWATLIACEVDDRLEVGVASAPALGTRWWAARGEGAHRRDALTGITERIHVSARARIEEAQVLYGSYALTTAAWGGRADRLLRASWRQRGFGDFWGHCLVAEGVAEVMLEGEIAPYDIAALMVIVEEAGGRMTDINDAPRIDAGHCITSNGVVHGDVLRVLRS
jgi:histidinol-phosphatase